MAYKHKKCVTSWIVSKRKHPRYAQFMKALHLLLDYFQEVNQCDFINIVQGFNYDSENFAFCKIKNNYNEFPKMKKRKIKRINGDADMYSIPPSQI